MNAQLNTARRSTDLLGLGAILVGSLPATLLREGAPARYTVEAVFTRRPDHDEVDAILGDETRAFLRRAGYPDAELTVSDRRLEIGGTNLEELRDGLGSVLAERLAEISEAVRARRLAADVKFQDASAQELARAAAVAALAESVAFVRPGDAGAGHPDVSRETSDDRARMSEWDEEGGASGARTQVADAMRP